MNLIILLSQRNISKVNQNYAAKIITFQKPEFLDQYYEYFTYELVSIVLNILPFDRKITFIYAVGV